MSDFYNKYPYTDFHELNLDWVIERVKKLTEDWLATHEEWVGVQQDWADTEQAWVDFKAYVETYLANLDVQDEIDHKIDQMVADGSLRSLIQPDVLNQTISTTTEWLAAHITQPTTPAVDTSLTIAGAAADAAVTGSKFSYILNNLFKMNMPILPAYEIGAWDGATGTDYGSVQRIRGSVQNLPATTVFCSVASGYTVALGYFDILSTWHFKGSHTSDFSFYPVAGATYKIQIFKTPAETVTDVNAYAYANPIYTAEDARQLKILEEFNLLSKFPYAYTGVISSDGYFSSTPGNFKCTDFIPVSGDIYVVGEFGAVTSSYYSITGYDENKNYNEHVAQFTTIDRRDSVITLDPNTKYIRVMSSVGYFDNAIFSYTGLLNMILDNIRNIPAYDALIGSKYDHKLITACDNTTGMATVGVGYGIAITDLIKKGSVISNIEFNNNLTVNSGHYVCFVGNSREVLAKFDIEGKYLNINYAAPADGFLIYAVNSGASFSQPMFYKNNVVEVPGKIAVKNYIIGGVTGISVGDILQARDYTTTVLNFVGCNITVYEPKAETSSPYSGLAASFLGDSLTQGYSYDPITQQSFFVNKPYPVTVGEILGCTSINKGYSGYPISSLGNANCLLSVYTTIPTWSKYIVCFAGTNDYFLNVPLGTLADRSDISFYGAVFTLIDGIRSQFPDAQLVFMTPIHRQYESANSVGHTLSDYVQAMKDVCRLCAIPCIDLYSESYMSYAVTESQTYYADGLHLTQDGYTLLGKIIAQYLQNIWSIVY